MNNNIILISLVANSNRTLTQLEAANGIIQINSSVNLTTTRDIVMPLTICVWLVSNNTDGGQSLQFIGASGTGFILSNAKKCLVYCDGTKFVQLGDITDSDDPVPAALVISGISVSGITQTGATVHWTTNQPSKGHIDYGITNSYGSSTAQESSFVTSHTQNITGLTANTPYHFRIAAINEIGTTANSSDATFTTAAVVPAPSGINVKDYGAMGNGSTDDTAAINRAITACPSGGTVNVPDGTYMINALLSVNLKSNMTFNMSSGAKLTAISNDADTYNIIFLYNVSNVTVNGGTLQGERATHNGSSGEWGMGLTISGGSNIVIDGVTAKDCWGDGFYNDGGGSLAHNLTFQNVTADNNRRVGLTLENTNGAIIRNSTFKNTNGTIPQAGIDFEPYEESQIVTNITVNDNNFTGNTSYGFEIWAGFGPVSNVSGSGNNFSANGENIYIHPDATNINVS